MTIDSTSRQRQNMKLVRQKLSQPSKKKKKGCQKNVIMKLVGEKISLHSRKRKDLQINAIIKS